MADEFDPALEGTRGAFAFVAAEMEHDELRGLDKLLSELEASEGWRALTEMLGRRREVALATLVHSAPQSTTAAMYTAVGGQIEALDWALRAPDAIRSFARERDEQEKAELERRSAAERS